MGLFSFFGQLWNESDRPSEPEDFRARLKRVVAALDLEVTQADHTGCMVAVPHNGVQYEVVIASLDGRTVLLKAISAVGFPPGELPEALFGTLDRMNRQMQTCQYVPHHGRRGSRFVVEGSMDVSRLTPETLLGALEELLPRAIGLDQYLLQHGYAR